MKGKFILGQKVWWKEQLVQDCPTCGNHARDTIESVGEGIIIEVLLAQKLVPLIEKDCDCDIGCLCMKKPNWDKGYNGKVTAEYYARRTDNIHNGTVILKEENILDKEPKKEKENV